MRILYVLAVLVSLTSCVSTTPAQSGPRVSDPDATERTRALFGNLYNQQGKGILFGQQHAVVQGQSFASILSGIERSDMLTSAGSLPAVHGYNINKLINFTTGETAGQDQIRELYSKGIVITMQWPADNPATGGDADDIGGRPVQEMVTAGTAANKRWLRSLDMIASYLDSLSVNGERVPVILRPMHEMTGGGNWYGTKTCTDAEYIAAWRYTVDYLRVKKGIHSILLAFAPTNITGDNYFDRYPGDAWVDIITFDNYDTGVEDYPAIIAENAALVSRIARERGKIAAIAEAGYKHGIQGSPFDVWYLDRLLTPLKANAEARQVAYLLTWTNASADSYWVPLPGQKNYEGFRAFCADPLIVLQRNMPSMYALPKP